MYRSSVSVGGDGELLVAVVVLGEQVYQFELIACEFEMP